MVTYVVVRPEVDCALGHNAGDFKGRRNRRRRWTVTDMLAQRYASNPDPLQQLLLKSLHGYSKDANSSEKGNRHSKGRNSFRFGKNKRSSGSRSTTNSGKKVQVKGHSLIDELEKKQGEIFRLLDFSEDAVQKNIPAYLVGFPSMILENVIALSRELEHLIPNGNSSELSSLMSRLNQTVADHAIWIDRYYLYGDDSHNEQTISEIVHNLRQAVQNLIDFVVNKEAANGAHSSFLRNSSNKHNESSSSIGSQDSPYSRKKYESRKSQTHGSMPEIPQAMNSFRGSHQPLCHHSPSPPKLTHSFSSDSILDKENVTSTPNPAVYVGEYEGFSSCDESAPPIPPKKGTRGRGGVLRSSYSGIEGSLINQSSSFNSSFSDGGSDFPDRRSAGSLLSSCGTPRTSLDHSLNCSLSLSSTASHDSMLHPNADGPPRGLDHRRGTSPHSHSSIDLSQRSGDRGSYVSQDFDLADVENDVPFRSGGASENRNFPSSRSFLSSNRETRARILSDSTKEILSHSYNTSNQGAHLLLERSARNSACSSSSRSSGSEVESNTIAMNVPPPIPKKTRHPTFVNASYDERTTSLYDNVDNLTSPGVNHLELRRHTDAHVVKSQNTCISYSSSTSGLGSSKSSMTSWESTASSNSPAQSSLVHRRYNESYSVTTNYSVISTDPDKPPLPRKKRHIMEYMQIFKDHEMPQSEWFENRRSQQLLSANHLPSITLSEDMKDLEIEPHLMHPRCSLPSPMSINPPALPPKTKSRSPDSAKLSLPSTGPVPEPESDNSSLYPELCVCQRKEPAAVPVSVAIPTSAALVSAVARNPELSPKRPSNEVDPRPPSSREQTADEEEEESVDEDQTETLLDRLNVDEHITFQGDRGESDVKSGSVDALVVYATYSKSGTYLEAFLTTYRTFITPPELIDKVVYRYHKFKCRPSPEYQKATKNAFSLLVRIVHDLVVTELTQDLLKDISEFEYNLLTEGDLKPALYFRKKLSEKLKMRKTYQEQLDLSNHYVSIKDHQQHSLLDFKSHEIADQMTLLDSKLFCKFGIPEMLHYAREQNEEHCPNLSAFAMQINRMSSWVKTQILKANAQDREKYYKKFIKIMKHLRKVNNNFNSCITILGGLESADVRRLDWPKSSMDMLKEYSDLFDFEGSYRAYRQALAETKPPCIPHLGVILQDLTKLHNINPNFVHGEVNFLKRWLQFNILEDMKRFIPCKYEIRKNEAILKFINDYEDCMSDSDLWDLSLYLKPKPKPK